jgi:hypothetical protein
MFVCSFVRAEWLPIAWVDGALWEYDPQRVSRKGHIIEVWIKSSGVLQKEVLSQKFTRHPELFSERERREFQDRYAYSLNRWSINCKDYQFALITGNDYKDDGTPLGVSSSRSEFSDITPDTLVDIAASKLCKKK